MATTAKKALDGTVLDRLYKVIESRRGADPAVSNTARLFAKGTEKIAQKVGEEAVRERFVPGPGARDGLRKCFVDPGEYTESDLIRRVADMQEAEFARLGLEFETLWGRRLHLVDCQNLFCEISKYARVAHPEVVGSSGRTRIKQKYRSGGPSLSYWYPPKWGINDQITRMVAAPRLHVAM